MQELIAAAEKIGAILKQRHETVAVAESSAGGLISAALLAIPGASAYYFGGAIVYTLASRRDLLGIPKEAFAGLKPGTEELALVIARGAQTKLTSTWAISELGAAGPTGTSYGHPAGSCWIAVAGPTERALTLKTNISDRYTNMIKFADAALGLLAECLASRG
jgi:PncC family amidohydrolase